MQDGWHDFGNGWSEDWRSGTGDWANGWHDESLWLDLAGSPAAAQPTPGNPPAGPALATRDGPRGAVPIAATAALDRPADDALTIDDTPSFSIVPPGADPAPGPAGKAATTPRRRRDRRGRIGGGRRRRGSVSAGSGWPDEVVPAALVEDWAPATPGASELIALVDRLQRENFELAGRLGYVHAQLQQANARLRLIEAPEEAPPGKPWWKRW